MRLVLLGSGGYHPTTFRETPCLALPEIGVVLDAGTGLWRLRKHLVTDELDIFLTHAHLDHIVGLTYLFDVLYGHSMRRVTVHGRARDLAAIRTHLLAPELFPAALPCDWREAGPPVTLPQGGTATCFPLEHPGGSLGWRLDWPTRSLAYVTDTTAAPDAAYLENIRGVDLLIHECYFPDELAPLAAKTGHSHASAVAALAAAAQVKRVVLTHPNPLPDTADPIGLDAARLLCPSLELGRDEQVLDF